MTEFGPNGEVVGTGPSDLSVDYRALSKDRKIRRVKLGLLLSSLAACLGVTLIGLFLTFVFGVLEGIGMLPTMFDRPNSGFLFGIQMAAMMSLFNFTLFFVTVPAAWLAMGLSIGRFPHQGIAARALLALGQHLGRPARRWHDRGIRRDSVAVDRPRRSPHRRLYRCAGRPRLRPALPRDREARRTTASGRHQRLLTLDGPAKAPHLKSHD